MKKSSIALLVGAAGVAATGAYYYSTRPGSAAAGAQALPLPPDDQDSGSPSYSDGGSSGDGFISTAIEKVKDVISSGAEAVSSAVKSAANSGQSFPHLPNAADEGKTPLQQVKDLFGIGNKSTAPPQPVGGFSSITGKSLLVTPSGQAVGSALNTRLVNTNLLNNSLISAPFSPANANMSLPGGGAGVAAPPANVKIATVPAGPKGQRSVNVSESALAAARSELTSRNPAARANAAALLKKVGAK